MSDESHIYEPTTEEILLMFSGGINHTQVGSKYKADADVNKSAASLMANVTAQNEREAKRLASLERAREARRAKKRGSQTTEDKDT
ncbi:hypothetical protein A4L_38 [Anabaena phage A-4L]|uniref:Uncharacterized protein n=1 Tax=Anabaena phage A-4L TaxID=1357732 RepID=A0A059PY93_9CAUD|nr:hypothetical protein A4L_38 [Anabaena phage A-4L]AGR48565.1 hypothetical protein A4L_38 [Anabaena phage A-4L]